MQNRRHLFKTFWVLCVHTRFDSGRFRIISNYCLRSPFAVMLGHWLERTELWMCDTKQSELRTKTCLQVKSSENSHQFFPWIIQLCVGVKRLQSTRISISCCCSLFFIHHYINILKSTNSIYVFLFFIYLDFEKFYMHFAILCIDKSTTFDVQ